MSTHDLALAHDRRLVLADLIALRQVGIEIVLAVEHRLQIDLRLQAEAGADRLPHAFLVDHRQHAGHRRIDQRDVRVGLAAERGRGAGEQLRLRGHLRMDLHADDDFPVAGRAFDQFRFRPLEHSLPYPLPRAVENIRVYTLLVDACTIRHKAAAVPDVPACAGTWIDRKRWLHESGLSEVMMTDNRARNGKLGAILGALIAVALAGIPA